MRSQQLDDVAPPSGEGDLAGHGTSRPASAVSATAATSIALYLLLTSRWGSYVQVPGLPGYVTDLVLLVVAGSTVLALARHERSPHRLVGAPVPVLLALVLAVGAGLRLLVGGDASLIALRDVAPYVYAALAALVFVTGPAPGRWNRVAWTVLAAHTTWVVLLPRLPGYPWNAPTLGTDATILVPRPDVDSCVLGVTTALALRALLAMSVRGEPARAGLLLLLGAASASGVLSLSTRAGLLATLLSVTAVVVAAERQRLAAAAAAGDGRRRRHGRLALVGTVLVLLAVVAGLASPTGGRLLDGLSGGDSEAAGTISVRREVWHNVVAFTFRTTEHTAIGIGFGRDFIGESGSQAALEGETYTNVRSPHNYVVGTFARLGAAGALLTLLIMVFGAALAWSALRVGGDVLSDLAALLALSLPVVALLGVVLESPFGAVPYFWAIGHLAAVRHERLARNQP